MKSFGKISTAIVCCVVALTALNIYFLADLYSDVKAQTVRIVEKCLERADIQEMFERAARFGNTNADTIFINMPLISRSSNNRKIPAYDQLGNWYFRDTTGYFNVTEQFVRVLGQNMHSSLDRPWLTTDYNVLDSLFRRELDMEHLYPHTAIVRPDTAPPPSGNLWAIHTPETSESRYTAYVSPLSGHVIRSMTGLVASSSLIFIAIGLSLAYLLRKVRSMRRLEEMKDDFVNNMTHELKTPIAIAYSANDTLLNYSDPADIEKRDRYLTAAIGQLERLSGLVERILSMSMERRRTFKLNPENVELLPLLTRHTESNRLKARKPTTFTLDISPENLSIEADPEHLGAIIDNLIDNAMKYSGDSVDIKIRADAGGISVTDNGIGIADRHLPHIWTRFWRVPQGNRQGPRGYGIGLYYVKSIVDKAGWDISVESKPGKGSCFTIHFNPGDGRS